jgi:predicted TPR repeat methyltransferase
MNSDKNKIAVEIFDKLADVYQNKFMNVSTYAKTLDLFCDGVRQGNAEILELACGPGNITHYLIENRPELKILGADLSPRMIERAKVNNPTADFRVMDCRDFSSLDRKYDGIVCGFLLPYLSKKEAIKLIADTSLQLKKKGILYLSTMEDDYSNSGLKKGSSGDEIFMHYHQADYLCESLEQNGFKLVEMQRIEIPEQELMDLILIAQKMRS